MLRLTALFAAGLSSVAASAATPDGRAGPGPLSVAESLTLDGKWVRGPARVEGGTLVLVDDRALTVGGHTCPVDRIVSLRFDPGGVMHARAARAASPQAIEQGVIFRNGDVLRGEVTGLQAGKVQLVSESIGAVEFPAAGVGAMAFRYPRRRASSRTPAASDGPDADEAGGSFGRPSEARALSVGPKAGGAGVGLANGDFVEGLPVWVNSETVGVKVGTRIVKLPRERTVLVRLGGIRRAQSSRGSARAPGSGSGSGARARATGGPPARQIVRLASGDRLSGKLVSLSASALLLEVPFAGRVRLPTAILREIWSEGGAVVSVSSMEPVEVREVPFFDERFPYRTDRNLAGSLLSVGGRRFERGIGCHSRCELTYALDGGFKLFLAEVGIDDAARGPGEVVFRVMLGRAGDGPGKMKTAYESPPVRAGERPRTVRVELGRARRMRLVVDFGPDASSVGDHADWGHAVLVR